MPKGKRGKAKKPRKGLTPRGGFMPPNSLSPFKGRRLTKVGRASNSTFGLPNTGK